MIATLDFLLIFLLLTVPVYWLLPDRMFALREGFLVAASTLLIFSLSPIILIWLGVYVLAIGAFVLAWKMGVPAAFLKAASWLFFVPLALIELVDSADFAQWILGPFDGADPNFTLHAYLGASYCAVRGFLIVRDGLSRGAFRMMSSINALTFFGSFIAGPIAGSNLFVREAVAPRLTLDHVVVGLCRIGWGAAIYLVLKPWIVDLKLPAVSSLQAAFAWLDMYRKFLTLYIDFAGYSEVAIGIAMLFGIRLPENFNNPLVSTSIQEFWQRWHMSLGAFISTYLFKPMVRAFGRPQLAMLAAFTLVGVWHSVTPTYLIWGLGHGTALFLNMEYRKRAAAGALPKWGQHFPGWLGWILTITWVAYLSAIANAPSLLDAGRFTVSLVGIQL